MPHVLIVDSEDAAREACRQVLDTCGCRTQEATCGRECLAMLSRGAFDLVLLDLKLLDLDGMEMLKAIRQEHPSVGIVVMAGDATVETAVETMRAGAKDLVPKPVVPEALRTSIQRFLGEDEASRDDRGGKPSAGGADEHNEIVGRSDEIRAIHDLVDRIGPTDSTVLITGESGTGKGMVAQSIHRHSPRRGQPFVTVDCGALVGTLFESELFGHVRGSFTSASATTHGRLELANGGTVFFDEITNIGLDIQAKLLRVIQEREFVRVGGNQAVRIDVRIIAATNRDPFDAMRTGQLREDLFYRLSVIPIVLPPLRRRRNDIPLLAQHFVEVLGGKRGKRLRGISPDAMAALVSYDWHGNVRELQNVIERAVVLAESDMIVPSDLLWCAHASRTAPASRGTGPVTLAQMEKEHIERILAATGGNKLRTAEKLGIDRKTLWRKIQLYGISAPLLGQKSPSSELSCPTTPRSR